MALVLQAAFIGLVQGLTEFIPVSSSARRSALASSADSAPSLPRSSTSADIVEISTSASLGQLTRIVMPPRSNNIPSRRRGRTSAITTCPSPRGLISMRASSSA